jgi:DNA-binding response OmpR family regulator
MLENPRILLVDDERAITDYLAPLLERTGFTVNVAYDGQTALCKAANQSFDLIILDILLPRIDGREVCRQFRALGNWTPVIMLTCVNETVDKVLSLEEGADDYLCKPFDPYELIARIRAVLRRKHSPPLIPLDQSDCLQAGDLVLNRRTKRVEVNGQVVDLTPKAMAVLEFLMLHPDQVFSRDQLMDAVWGWSQVVASRAVDMRIVELRHVLGEKANQSKYIETVVGFGYRFIMPVSAINGENH